MDAKILLKHIQSEFAPMAQSLGLVGPKLIKVTHTIYALAYFGNGIGLRIDAELQEFFLYAYVFRAEGKKVPFGSSEITGKLDVIYLQEAMKLLTLDSRVEDQKMRSLRNNWENYKKMAEIITSLILSVWPDIQENRAKLFQI